MDKQEYLKMQFEKKAEMESGLKPLMDKLEIKDWMYEVDERGDEYLHINDTRICCTFNSLWACENEVYKWYICHLTRTRKIHLGYFHKQTINHLKEYWLK